MTSETAERREAAWERYRGTLAMRRVLANPEAADVRLAFEAGYAAATFADVAPLEALVRGWRERADEIRAAGDTGPVMLAIAEDLLIRSDDLEDAIGKAR